MAKYSKKLAGIGEMALVMALMPLFSGCGSTSLTVSEKLVVAMIGAFEAPTDATGNAEPRSQTYSLEDVSVVDDSGTAASLFSGEPISVRIINRSQIIYEAKLSDYAGKTLSGISVTFAPDITGSGKIESAMTATLATPTLTYTDSVSVPKGEAQRLTIKVQWKNTVTQDLDAGTETMTAPSFSLAVGKD